VVVVFFFFFGVGAGVGVLVSHCFTLPKTPWLDAARRSAVTAKANTTSNAMRNILFMLFAPVVTRLTPVKPLCSCEYLLRDFRSGNSR
jgi:hypothetical protein